MNDVFISYSRRDKVFTQKLFEALEAADRSVWADWDDIPAASDWDAEIKEGIQQSQSVLFVLSPEWIKSNECRKELNHAVEMGKRLFPILYLPVDPKDVPPELARINWVYMRDSDDFDKSFQTLCSAMDTDLEWIKRHTRLQVRALEWDKKNRDQSFALRGNDLTEAEQFISSAAHKSPEPTALQGEYIVASRRDASRRQRLTLIGVTAALVISVVLGVVALFQRQAAVLNAKIAFSRELAAGALNNLDADPERSLLLALQSVAISDDADQPISRDTEDALRQAVQTSRVRASIPAHEEMIEGVAFSPDGHWVATASADKIVKVWEVSGADKGYLGTEPKYTFTDFTDGVITVAFSPDGHRLAAGGVDGSGMVLDLETGDKLFTLDGHTDSISKIIFSPDGKSIVTASFDSTLRIWDAGSGQMRHELAGHSNSVAGVASYADGSKLISVSVDGEILLWDASTGEQEATLEARCPSANDVAVSSDGETFVFGNNCLTAEVHDLSKDKWLYDMDEHTDVVTAVAFSPDGSMMVSASRDNTLIAVDRYTGRTKFKLIDTSDINALAFSPDGAYIVTGNVDGQLKLWDANPISNYEILGFRPHTLRIDGMQFSPDAKHLVTSSWDGSAFIWSLNDQKTIELSGHQDQVRDVVYSPDGKTILTGGYDGIAILWDAATGDPIRTLSGDSQNVMAVAFSPDGKFAVGGRDDTVVLVWDVNTGSEVATLQSNDQFFINEVAFSPDGKTLAVANDNVNVTLWDTATWKQKGILEGHTDWVKSIAFSPDGTRIVTGSYDTHAILWDAKTYKPLITLNGHGQGINDVAFSPDGTLVATASVDRSARLWDADTGKVITSMVTSDPILSVAFSLDGKVLATGSESGVLRLYYVDADTIVSLAQARITRSLTELECQTYLHTNSCPSSIDQPGVSADAPAQMHLSLPLRSTITKPAVEMEAPTPQSASQITRVIVGDESGNEKGQFVQTNSTIWTEQSADGNTFNYEETSRDEYSITLFDASRNVTIQLDLQAMVVNFSDETTEIASLYQILKAE